MTSSLQLLKQAKDTKIQNKFIQLENIINVSNFAFEIYTSRIFIHGKTRRKCLLPSFIQVILFIISWR